MPDAKTISNVKSWIIPYLSAAIGLGFTALSFLFDVEVNETHVQLLDYLLYLTLGSGAVGAANAGFKRYTAYKANPDSTH